MKNAQKVYAAEMTEETKAPTPKQLEVLRAFYDAAKANYPPPTMRELRRRLSVSHNAIFERISWLEKKGHLAKSPGERRCFVITGSGVTWVRRSIEDAG